MKPRSLSFESFDEKVDKLLASLFGKASLWGRKKTAKRLDSLGKRLKDNPSDIRAIRDLKRAAESRDRFERCHAIDVLGELANPSLEVVQLFSSKLCSEDPFMRRSASQALAHAGTKSATEIGRLLTALERYPREDTALFVILTLREIGKVSTEVLRAIKKAATAKDAYSPEDAWATYHQLSGVRFTPSMLAANPLRIQSDLTEEAFQAAVRSINLYWRKAVFEDPKSGKQFECYWSAPLDVVSDVIIYYDRAVAASFRATHPTLSFHNRIIRVMVIGKSLNLIADDPNEAGLRSMEKSIRERLNKDEIFKLEVAA